MCHGERMIASVRFNMKLKDSSWKRRPDLEKAVENFRPATQIAGNFRRLQSNGALAQRVLPIRMF
jgi:hypothetical protein